MRLRAAFSIVLGLTAGPLLLVLGPAGAFAAYPGWEKYSAEVDAEIREICPYDAKLCEDYKTLKDGLMALQPDRGAVSSTAARVSLDELTGLLRAYAEIFRQTQTVIQKQKEDSRSRVEEEVFQQPLGFLDSGFAAVCAREISGEIGALPLDLSGQEAAADGLEKDLRRASPSLSIKDRPALAARLRSINEAGTILRGRISAVSLAIEEMSAPVWQTGAAEERSRLPGLKTDLIPLDYGRGKIVFVERKSYLSLAGWLAEEAGPLDARIARLSRRLQTLEKELSGGSFEASQTKVNALPADPFASSGAPSEKAAVSADLLHVIHAPASPPRSRPRSIFKCHDRLNILCDDPAPPAPLHTGQARKEDSQPGLSAWVEKMRALRLTRTYGDPEGRAKYVFQQGWLDPQLSFYMRSDTCGFAAQVEMLEEAGLAPLDPAGRKKWERRFYHAAVRAHYFDGGITHERLGSFVALYMQIRRHYLASEEELLGVVEGGKMVIVSVNTGMLWNDSQAYGSYHVVVVTGAEVGLSGELLGYYINDTYTGEGARFVTARQFLEAWRSAGGVFIEPY